MEELKLINKRAQIWGMDLFVAVGIFSIAMVFFYTYASNSAGSAESKIQSLSYEGGVLSETILSEGYPANWDASNVLHIGILSDGKINDTKVWQFYNLTLTNYSNVKRLFNTPYDFYFFLDTNMSVGNFLIDGIGKVGVNRYSIESDDLIKINRIAIYQNKIIGAKIYIWD